VGLPDPKKHPISVLLWRVVTWRLFYFPVKGVSVWSVGEGPTVARFA